MLSKKGMVLSILFVIGFLVASACAPAAAPTPAKPAATSAPAEQKPSPMPVTPTAAAAKPSAAPVKVRTATLGILADAGIFIALEKGYFKEQNLDVELVKFATSGDTIAPMAAGQLEVGVGGISAGLFNAMARGIDAKIVADKAPCVAPGCTAILVVRKDLVDSGQYKGPADLKGKTIGFPSQSGSIAHPAVDAYLKKAGLDLKKDVTISVLRYPDINTAFANKSLDAAIHLEPFITLGVEQGLYVRTANYSEMLPDTQVGVLMYAPQFMQKEPEAARNFMVAYIKGVRDYYDAFFKKDAAKKKEVVQILMKSTGIQPAELYDKMGLDPLNPDGYVLDKSIEKVQDWFAAEGDVQTKVDVKRLVDNQYVDYALQKLGKYQR